MDNGSRHFADVTLLITHYNRSKSLERLLNKLAAARCSFGEIVVSDDCSVTTHLNHVEVLSKQFGFKLVTSLQNKGLGNNMNKGQDAVTNPYTLYVQEDFIPLENFIVRLADGQSLLEEHSSFDMVRFYAYECYPHLKYYKAGFSEMLFKWWYPGLGKFAYYSDHPHLRRSGFLDKFGRYIEGTSGDKTEFSMMMSFLKKQGKAFFYNEYKSVFEQVNSSLEPSTMKRNMWRNSNNIAIRLVRVAYRYLNYYSALYVRKF